MAQPRHRGTDLTGPRPHHQASVGGGRSAQDDAADPCTGRRPAEHRADLPSLFAMPDLGASGVVGGRRLEGLPLEREARVSGATSHAPAATSRRTVALSDGTRITFSDAGRLLESA